MERFLMKVLDKSWHVQCVKCSECQCLLSEKCFSRENKLYCRSDFFKQYGTQCASCKIGVCPEDLVRRAVNKVYHVQCFKCSVCKHQLNTGEQLYLVQGEKFLCDGCYPAPAPPQPAGIQTVTSQSVVPPVTTTSSSVILPQPEKGDSDSGMLLTDPTAVADSRRGKTRTSINAKQLEILQATYEKEPRPSRVMREEIAAQTGLSLKVIQVWFQNRRSKDKKDVTKGDPGSALSVKSELGSNRN